MTSSNKLNLLKNSIGAIIGNRESAYMLGQCYLNGIGTLENSTKGMAWIEKAADKGHPEALYISGLNALEYKHEGELYLRHMQEYKMHAKGLISLTLAGIYGHPDAQMRLALHHESASNTYRDLFEAASWYKLAAASKNQNAIEWIANNRQYVKYARAFNTPEIEMLRADILSGTPVAVLLFAKAIFEGEFSYDVYADALRLLFRFGHWAKIYPGMFDRQKTKKLYNDLAASAINGSALALYLLGGGIESAVFNQDIDDAVNFYTQAAEKGNPDACYRLGIHYQGIENKVEKEKYMELAQKYGFIKTDYMKSSAK